MITKEDFLKAGFVADNDPMFKFRKELLSEKQIIESNLEEDEVPCLLFGNSGINKGFCIYTGEHFVFFNAESPDEAVEFSEKITAFETV